MSHSKNPERYPMLCWNVAKIFAEGAREFTVDGQELRETDAPLPPEEARRRAKAFRFQLNAFRTAVQAHGLNEALILDGLEFCYRETADGGQVVIKKRDNNMMARGLERAFARQGYNQMGEKIGGHYTLPPTGMPAGIGAPISKTTEMLSTSELAQEVLRPQPKHDAAIEALGFNEHPAVKKLREDMKAAAKNADASTPVDDKRGG